MLISTHGGFDVFELFCHDKCDTGGVDSAVVADLLTQQINDRSAKFHPDGYAPHVEVYCPDHSGVSRFTALLHGEEPKVLPDLDYRPHRTSEVKKGMPKWLVETLFEIQELHLETHDGDNWSEIER